MYEQQLPLIISIVALVISILTFIALNAKIKEKPEAKKEDSGSKQLQLQAYERLVLLTERLALPNLIGRVTQTDLSASEMRILLVESMKQEFEYNTSQQVYVSPAAWDAIRNLKEQNTMVVNQVAAALPPTATGQDLKKILIDVTMRQDKEALHSIVLEALNYEAKRLLS